MFVGLQAGKKGGNRSPFNTIAIAVASSLVLFVFTSCSSRKNTSRSSLGETRAE